MPQVNNNIINLLIENKALEDDFIHHKPEFLGFLRETLSNYKMDVVTQINKEFKTKKAYTPQEKFEKMREKNPDLELLRKTLDMDVGYA